MRNQLLGHRYRILDLIGEGGMAYVYVAVDEKLGRRVAVKVLHEHMERNPDIRQRFQAEAQAISAFDHPNIVKIYDFSGDQVGRLWIVTEVINGKNLAQFVQNFTGGWLHPVIAACIVREICKALAMAHSHGIVHRDIKPENIMMTVDGRVKLMDFGIAKDLGKSSVTVTGTFMGSPSYMSPEQIRGRDVDWRSDLYSLSVLFYEVVTGRLPFVGTSTHDVVLKIMEGNYTHPRYLVPGLPSVLNDLIVAGMAKQPQDRPQSADDYGDEIDRILVGLGFDESHIELERYFRDREAYHERLTLPRTGLSHAPMPPAPPAARARELTPPPQSRPFAHAGRSRQVTSPPQAEAAPAPQVMTAVRRQPSAIAPPPQEPTQYLATAPRASARPLHHQARPQLRRMPRTMPPAANQGGLGYAFGSFLIGLACAFSLWGFWQLQTRLATHTHAPGTAATSEQDWREGARAATKTTRQAAHPKRDGTPAVTVHVTAERDAPETAASHATEPHGLYPTRRPSEPAPLPRPPTPKHLPVKHQEPAPKAELVTTPLETPAPKPSDQDPKRPKKPAVTPAVSEPASEPAAPLAPAASEKSDKPAKETQPAPERDKAEKRPELGEKAEKAEGKAQPLPHGKGTLIVSSQPAAEVYVDGRRLGTTIDNTADSGPLSLPAGAHNLELRRSGYAPTRRHFDVSANATVNLQHLALEIQGSRPAPGQTVELTISTNQVPAQVTIRNLGTNATQIIMMKTATKLVSLPAGHYKLRVERSGEVKEKEINLTGNEGARTFVAEFKNAE